MTTSHHSGFSLPELMITLSLLAILATVAIPALAHMQQQQRNRAAIESLNSILQYARSQALLEKRMISLCPSIDGKRCTNDWNQPWLLKTSDGKILSHAPAYAGNTWLGWSGFTGSIVFHPNGTSPTSNGRFFLCMERTITHQLIINRQGRVRRGTPQENRDESRLCR